MKSNFLDEVLSVLQPFAIEVKSLADAAHIDAAVFKLPWRGQNIDWKNQRHQVIDLSQEGDYSSESIPQAILRQFLALQGERVVMMFSAYEAPVAMAVDDFVENWFVICSNLTFLPKIILVSADEQRALSPNIIEIDPMQFIRGNV